jgi:hypothetical protein
VGRHATHRRAREPRPALLRAGRDRRLSRGPELLRLPSDARHVWEWTSSEFLPYPGFEVFPYREYSEIHFGRGYRVLRGGSFATQELAIRNTFRNWDLPQRRQIFAASAAADV